MRHELILKLVGRPGFCCGCICLDGEDRDRVQRVLAVTRVWSRAFVQC